MQGSRTLNHFARFTPPEATLFICCKTDKESASVEEKQKEILDSIRYAKRIQQSLLPTEKYIDKKLKELKN